METWWFVGAAIALALVAIVLLLVARRRGAVATAERPARPPARKRHGVGLAATRARLQTIHGDRASLSLMPRTGGGAVVRVEIPRKIAERASRNAAHRDETMQPA